MPAFDISLNSITDVKNFVNIVNKYSCDIELKSGKYIVDAKSIMGILSLDLSKPIKIEFNCDNSEQINEDLKPYIV